MLDLVVRPGDVLAGRYRLAERYGGPGDPDGAAATWWARDEALDRPVWVTLLPDRDGDAAAVLAAARAAASCQDPRFLRVFDVGTDALRDGTVDYLVTEALAGPTVADLLAGGPIAPERARALTLAVAAALSTAHAHGLSHRRLRLQDIRCPDASFSDLTTVRIAGLELAAALDPLGDAADNEADSPARDAEACGAVLYAALTGHWPGPGPSRLPPAPHYGGRPCSPRQVRAGVPVRLDAVARSTLALHPRGAGAGVRLSTPAQVAAALADPSDLGRPDWRARSRRAPAGQGGRRQGRPPLQALPWRPGRAGGSVRWPAIGPAPVRLRAAAVLAASAPLALGVLGLWGVPDVSSAGGSGLVRLAGLIGAAPAAPTPAASATPAAPAVAAVAGPAPTTGTWQPSRADAAPVVRAVRAFPPAGSDAPVSDPAAAVDGNLETAWRTRSTTAEDARAGTAGGLLLDLGGTTALRRVDLVLLGRPTDVELRVGGEDLDPATAVLADYRRIGAATGSGSRVTIDLGERVPARYVLVRLLGLPAVPEAPGDVRGGVADVRLHR